MTLSAAEIESLMITRGFGSLIASPQFSFSDATYSLPTLSWVTGPFAESLKANLKLLGLDIFADEEWDCDDFANLTACIAKACHRLTTKQSANQKTGLAFGWISYLDLTTFPPVFHRANMAVALAGGQPTIMFFEPQTAMQINLTEDEIGGIRRVEI